MLGGISYQRIDLSNVLTVIDQPCRLLVKSEGLRMRDVEKKEEEDWRKLLYLPFFPFSLSFLSWCNTQTKKTPYLYCDEMNLHEILR